MQAPYFWSEKSLLSDLLVPLGAIYAAATRYRLRKGQGYRAAVPVICVGNVTAGGSGKTPIVQALAKAAIGKGIAVHCLTRGYGGQLAGPLRVDPNVHSARDVGDEALLLAAIAPCWVCRDRAAGAVEAIAAGAQLLILDDGLQNSALVYDLSLLVIDGGFGFGNGRVIPAGPLREPLSEAAARAGAAVLIGTDVHNAASQLPGLTVIRAQIVPQDNQLKGKRVIAFAGLGRPEKFRETVTEIGADIVGWFPFPDHHPFTGRDLDDLAAAAKAASALLVTTEKDFVRLPQAFRSQVTALGIDLVPDEASAWNHLIAKACQ